ncbi:MAG: hypothetical protein IJ708_09745 [Clostridia bacterium]|nr:hypothetical protein [Clostridia bacterium]
MRFSVNGNWKDGYTHDGMLFFAQRVEEMLMYYTSHVYKVPVYNTYLLIEEFSRTYNLVKQGAVNQTHLALILEEFYASLSGDIIIQTHFSRDEIDQFISHLKSVSIENQMQFMHYLWHCFGQYPEWCREEARKIVDYKKDKKKIEKIARSLVSTLIGVGYHPRFIYRFCKKTFSSKDICDSSALDVFLDRFDWTARDYVVYFAVDKSVQEFKSILETRLGISFEEDRYFRQVQFDSNTQICLHLKTKAVDSDSAAEFAYRQFNLFVRYYKFFGNRSGEWCANKTIVVDSEGKVFSPPFLPQGYRYSQDYDSRTLGRNSEFAITSLLENTERDDFYKVNKIIQTHNVALESSDMGNGFLNLWSVLEIMGVSHHEESKIKEIMNSVVPVLKRNYLCIVFEELHDYLKANLSASEYQSLLSNITESGDEELKIACIVMMKKYDETRKTAYSMLAKCPLIRSRISQQYADIFSDKKKLLSEFDRYEQRLRWHIQRLYRTRNSIIHSGEVPDNISSLGEHLHDYVDELILEIVDKLTRKSSLGSIDNVIIDAQMFMDRIYQSYKGGGELLEEDVRLLLGKEN